MYDRILVPTDGSATAEAAMEHANDLARRYEADVHVLHVIDSRQYDTSIESAVDPLWDAAEADHEHQHTEGTGVVFHIHTDVDLVFITESLR